MIYGRSTTCCFTGHRKIPPEKKGEISRRLKTTLIRLIEEGYVCFGAGGAFGFDTLATQCVLSLKNQYPHQADFSFSLYHSDKRLERKRHSDL